MESAPVTRSLTRLAELASFIGYIEILFASQMGRTSVMTELVRNIIDMALPVADYPIKEENDVWEAIRAFFRRQVLAAEE